MKRGFSLVELVIACAIVIVIAALVSFVYLRSSDRGKVAKCLSNLGQLGLAVKLYAEDYDDCTPVVSLGNLEQLRIWKDAVKPYASDEVFYCPSDRSARNPARLISANSGKSFYTSYSSWIGPGSIYSQSAHGYYYAVAAVPNPATTVQMSEYTHIDYSRCDVDEHGTFFWNYSPHAERQSWLYWDGHVKSDVNPWYRIKNYMKGETCAEFDDMNLSSY